MTTWPRRSEASARVQRRTAAHRYQVLAESTRGNARFDEQIRASASSVSLEGYPYLIEMADGRMFSGCVESGGALPRMMTGDNASEYTVYWGDDALENSNEN